MCVRDAAARESRSRSKPMTLPRAAACTGRGRVQDSPARSFFLIRNYSKRFPSLCRRASETCLLYAKSRAATGLESTLAAHRMANADGAAIRLQTG